MNNLKKIYILLLAAVSINVLAWNVAPFLQDDLTRRRGGDKQQTSPDDKNKKNNGKDDKKDIHELVIDNEDSIPDSLLNPIWKIQRISPITFDDLNRNTADLKLPDNLMHNVVYNDTLDRYVIGS